MINFDTDRTLHSRLTDRTVVSLAGRVSAFVQLGFVWVRKVRTRRAIAELTPEQLMDIGQASEPKPIIRIQPGLMTRLMSMR